MIDIAFLTQTFLRLLSALPVTLGLFFPRSPWARRSRCCWWRCGSAVSGR